MAVGERTVYTACEVKGPNLIAVRRCATCGAMAEAEVPPSTRVMGRLPEACVREHGNCSVEVHVIAPNAPRGVV